MVNFSVATNFDSELLKQISKLNQQYTSQVIEVYGSLPFGVVGTGRAGAELPQITYDTFSQHVSLAHRLGFRFSYLLNANAGINLKDAGYVRITKTEIDFVLSAGVDSLTISDDSLIDLVRKEYPQVKIHLSVIAGVGSVQEAKRYADKGITVITLNQHMVNRNFRRIEEIVKSVPEVDFRLYANVSCLHDCPMRNEHYRYLSMLSRSESFSIPPKPNYYLISCALRYLRSQLELLKSPFIRPEDVNVYEELGIKTFKLSDRREPTSALINLVQVYLAGEFHGNLFNLLFREGRKWTNAFRGVNVPPAPDIFIDNDKLTKIDFSGKIKALNGVELEDFYALATSYAVRNTDSQLTAGFRTWMEEKYVKLIKAAKT